MLEVASLIDLEARDYIASLSTAAVLLSGKCPEAIAQPNIAV
jgi:hypothetical protein